MDLGVDNELADERVLGSAGSADAAGKLGTVAGAATEEGANAGAGDCAVAAAAGADSAAVANAAAAGPIGGDAR